MRLGNEIRGLSLRRCISLAASLAALAACQPSAAPDQQPGATPPAETATSDGPVTGCAATAQTMWGPIGPSDHPSYRIEAHASGGICEAAVVTLAIRARDGFPIYAWAGAAQYLFGLADQPDTAAMNKALAEWLDSGGIETTDGLPLWDQTEGQPNRAEFPFMPAEWIDKQTWEAMRAEKLHTFCFPQGMESLNCLVLRDGQVEEIGLQLFPG